MRKAREIEYPTAAEVAHALVAAARVMGDDPLAAFDGQPHRFRAPAARALSIFYPDLSLNRVAALVGYSPEAGGVSVKMAEKAQWWTDGGGTAALDAAFAALEAL